MPEPSVPSSPSPPDPEQVPLGQRLYDNVFLWLIAGIAVVSILYTGWGIWEVLTLPPATLP
jgi:hypothetical protein